VDCRKSQLEKYLNNSQTQATAATREKEKVVITSRKQNRDRWLICPTTRSDPHLCSLTVALDAQLSLLFDDELDDEETSLLLHLILSYFSQPNYETGSHIMRTTLVFG
jgi:hypothetical protein